MKIWVLIILWTQTLFAVSFEQLRNRLWVNSPEIKALVAQKQAYDLERQVAERSLYPTLSTSAAYLYSSAVPQMELSLPLPVTLGGAQVIQKSLGDHDRTELGVDLNYLLWSGGQRSAQIQLKALQSNTPLIQLTGLKIQLESQLALLFLQAQIPQLRSQNLIRRNEYLTQQKLSLQAQISQGVEIKFQLLAIESQLAKLANDLLQEECRLDSIKNEIRNLVGDSSVDLASLDNFLPDRQLQLEELGSVYTRSEYQLLDHSQKVLGIQSQSLRAEYFPKIMTQLSYKYANPGLNQGGNEWMSYAQFGVQFKWSLWDAGLVGAQLQVQAKNSQIIEFHKQSYGQKWEQKKAKILKEWESLGLEKSNLILQKMLADSAVNLAQVLFQKGLLSTIELNHRKLDAIESALPLEIWEIRRKMLWIQWRVLNSKSIGDVP